MFDLHDSKPVKFHPYTSRTKERVFEVSCGSDSELAKEYRYLEEDLLNLFNRSGIKCDLDNKIVFECEVEGGKKIFYGFYDWTFSIGLSYYDENEKR